MEQERPSILQGQIAPQHPWQGFAHADLEEAEFESLPRTLRFALIQINKFWVEIQSFPLFMKELRHANVGEIERLLHWLEAAPDWGQMVQDGRVIPELAKTASRRQLIEFARDAKAIRILRKLVNEKLTAPNLDLLIEGVSIVEAHGLQAATQAELQVGIRDLQARLSRIRGVMRFFEELVEHLGVPHAHNAAEAQQLFQAIDAIGRIPAQVTEWRHPQILDPQKRIRIESWQDRMRPTLDMRKRLQAHFRMSEKCDPHQLRGIADAIMGGGVFKKLKPEYKEAVRAYRDLLLDPLDKNVLKETPFQMAEKLNEWADHLDQARECLENSDAFGFFGKQYRGIDTKFAAALEANAWAAQVREEFGAEHSSFGSQLVDLLFAAEKGFLDEAFVRGTSGGAEAVRSIVSSPEFAEEREFVEFAAEVESKLSELIRLREVLNQLGALEGLSCGELEELKVMTDECAFLDARIEANSNFKEWFRSAYRGADTDLRLVEQALPFVKFIEQAQIPDTLKLFFLVPHGPQRLSENRKLVAAALVNLAQVKDHFQKLDLATAGEVATLLNGPVPVLMERIQMALNQRTQLPAWVRELRNAPAARAH